MDVSRRDFLKLGGVALTLPVLDSLPSLGAEESAKLAEPKDWILPIHVEYNGYNGGNAHSEVVNGALYKVLAAELSKKGIDLVPRKGLRDNKQFVAASGYKAPENVDEIEYAANLGGRYQASEFEGKQVEDDPVLGKVEKAVKRYRIRLNGNYTYDEKTTHAGTVQQSGGATGGTLDELTTNALMGVGAGQKLSFYDQLMRQIGVYTLRAYVQGKNPVNGFAFMRGPGGDTKVMSSKDLFTFKPAPLQVPVQGENKFAVFPADHLDVIANDEAHRFWYEQEGTGPLILGSQKTQVGEVEIYRSQFMVNPLKNATQHVRLGTGWVRDMVAFMDTDKRAKIAYIAQGPGGSYSQVGIMDGETGEVLRTVHHKYGNLQQIAVTQDPVTIKRADGKEEEIMVLAVAGLNNLFGQAEINEKGKLVSAKDRLPYTPVLSLLGTGTGSLADPKAEIQAEMVSFPDAIYKRANEDVPAFRGAYNEFGYWYFTPRRKGGVGGLTITTDEEGQHSVNVVPGGEDAPNAFSLPLEKLLDRDPKERFGGLPEATMIGDGAFIVPEGIERNAQLDDLVEFDLGLRVVA